MTTLRQQLKALPPSPGVYLFKDTRGRILYVGKAKHLRSRIRSYFSLSPSPERPRAAVGLDPAKQQMVPRIADIETISCDTETEALVLEANLIRQHQPPFNVVLRDDKFYLFIKITTNEQYPRVFPTRRLHKDGARYFGPYSSAAAVRQTLGLLRRIFPYRGEKENPRERIFPHPLFSDSGTKGHSPQTTNYELNIMNIIRFLSGQREHIATTLWEGMKKASRQRHYERAAIFRDQLRAIERLEGDQKVFLPGKDSLDTISIARAAQGNMSCANVFQVRDGKLLSKNTFLLRHRSSTPAQDILRQFFLQYYGVAQNIPPVILLPAQLEDALALARWVNKNRPPLLAVPQRGKKRQLLAMGELNAKQTLEREVSTSSSGQQAKTATQELARALGLPDEPLKRIETYDISNIQGMLATGALIVFTGGQPDKKHYRKFRLHADQPNDYAMMQEVLRRRFSARHADWETPDLILIDGGRGQLSAARKVLAELHLTIPAAALAKREETLFTVVQDKTKEIRLPYDSPALFLLQRMRDESHRFTLSYHRLLRSKHSRRSLLDEVPGIGPKTKRLLLNRFGSLRAIRAASATVLEAAVGKSKAKALRDYL
jgi:excinuclease ABC subunit C